MSCLEPRFCILQVTKFEELTPRKDLKRRNTYPFKAAAFKVRIQNHNHLLNCSQLELDEPCKEDLMQANPKDIHVANFWKFKI
ncbi:hypothetical protein M8J77_019251 [Diaphorina citri]|nr:hypothetical protein M8J77_019251 [Diaphorina citri]